MTSRTVAPSKHPSLTDASQWIELKDGKDFSRLLYTNPVCFLSSCSCSAAAPAAASTFTVDNKSNCKSVDDSHASLKNPARPPPRRNVMVLSWLTATNNSGGFTFSLNRRRHTASILVPHDDDTEKPRTGIEFVLSVPVKGMEQLVVDVGGTSGKWGSKFSDDYDVESLGTTTYNNGNSAGGEIIARVTSPTDLPSMSNPQKKKLKKQQFSKGVPGLVAVPFGYASAGGLDLYADECFAIEGTCAHLKCRTYAVVTEPPNIIDEDHHLIMAEVVAAYVHNSYWHKTKKQFRPLGDSVPPYLTFFGAQRFGYVCYGDNT